MPSFAEMNYKVNISIGLLIFIVVATFSITSFYIKQNTMEDRMNKRYDRQQHDMEIMRQDIKQLQVHHKDQ